MSIMFKADRKKIAAQMTGGVAEKAPEHVIGESDKIYAALAGDLMDALKSGSAHDVAKSLKAFIAQADSEQDEE